MPLIRGGASTRRTSTRLRHAQSNVLLPPGVIGSRNGIDFAIGAYASSSRSEAPHLSLPCRSPRRTLSTSSSHSAWLPQLPFSSSSSSKSASASILASNPIADPLTLLSRELGALRSNVQSLLGSGHPSLDTIAKYYFQAEGKHVRPMVVLLMSQATNGLAPGWEGRREQAWLREEKNVDDALERRDVLNDDNPDLFQAAKSFFSDPLAAFKGGQALGKSTTRTSAGLNPTNGGSSLLLLPSQRRLAEITEMIHVASLLHDDVIDLATTRRGAPSAPSLFGNKLSVLAGDFLLARASLALSRLDSNEVVELVASVLANLVEGEVMQMKGNVPPHVTKSSTLFSSSTPTPNKLAPEIFEHYMKKTYLKTASLIAKSTRATTVLAGCGVGQGWAPGERIKDIAYIYGRNLGIAFQVRTKGFYAALLRINRSSTSYPIHAQLTDDMLDFTSSAAELGKPGGGADLKLGLATAPALYAWEEFPDLGSMIERKFSERDDVERAIDMISRSSGAERTFELAQRHSQVAVDALKGLPESAARDELERIARETVKRKK
ncbi:BQ5605_C020g09061 [Microbotryum silenes-dioicae]|uniref:(2E,6E)-farnesyl diphosphate synthase n=1 Tax=Microbotryum silenes-dioicae TaxID=796604 RepID=A0A2X0N5H1_9BASI|nr:BQ5605_C020g09061 [Microbotryum silenes-dioicae]